MTEGETLALSQAADELRAAHVRAEEARMNQDAAEQAVIAARIAATGAMEALYSCRVKLYEIIMPGDAPKGKP